MLVQEGWYGTTMDAIPSWLLDAINRETQARMIYHAGRCDVARPAGAESQSRDLRQRRRAKVRRCRTLLRRPGQSVLGNPVRDRPHAKEAGGRGMALAAGFRHRAHRPGEGPVGR